jgi:hypothetical protein
VDELCGANNVYHSPSLKLLGSEKLLSDDDALILETDIEKIITSINTRNLVKSIILPPLY